MAVPKMGEAIPVEKFFVSKTNIRVEEEFGHGLEDVTLTEHLGKEDIVQPFTARPEGEGFGVVIGRRRFLAKRKSGAEKFIVGEDCLIKEMTDDEAFDASLRENLDIFQKKLNPILRAKTIQRLLDMKKITMRELSRNWRVPTSNMSEFLKILELSKAMQVLVEKGMLSFRNALKLARLGLNHEIQDKLASILEKQGIRAFLSELNRLQSGQKKRGAPAGKYAVDRITWDLTDPEESEPHGRLEVLANSTGKEVGEYCKIILIEHAMGKH